MCCDFDVKATTHRLRNLATVERSCVKILAGWWLYAPAWEAKNRLAYHLIDHAEHVTWLRGRLAEMRGGQPNAAVAPGLRRLMEEALHAPSTDSMLRGLYGVIKPALLEEYRHCLAAADPAANGAEVRLFKRIIPELATHQAWYEGLEIEDRDDRWPSYLERLLDAAGGIGGERPAGGAPSPFGGRRFERAKTIHFDHRIRRGPLTSYETRRQMDPHQGVVEQFKVFFNEHYAAALVASVIYDAFDDGLPWEFYADLSRHFWDEVRHSEFGAVRLKELGEEPGVCDPVLFEQSESLSVLHRIAYLTYGLETYFMPRKQPRVREYEQTGDLRSRLFADHDWSDEITHVRYGSKWMKHLLEDDHRTVEDVLEEVRCHLEKQTGQPQETIQAPF